MNYEWQGSFAPDRCRLCTGTETTQILAASYAGLNNPARRCRAHSLYLVPRGVEIRCAPFLAFGLAAAFPVAEAFVLVGLVAAALLAASFAASALPSFFPALPLMKLGTHCNLNVKRYTIVMW